MTTNTANTEITNETIAADQALKAKHRGMWESGNYGAVASDLIASLGEVLVEATKVTESDRVLDVAAGTGNAAIPAALRGAAVVATDLAPALLEEGQVLAKSKGAVLDWRTADAEALPFGDAEFDTVLSCVGVMFAPHHQETADELLRVTRPGGTIGLINWTPAGFIGQLFATMKPFAPPPPAGAQPPPAVGKSRSRPEPLRRSRRGHHLCDSHRANHAVPGSDRLPRLLQTELRTDDRGVRRERRRTGPGRRVGQRHR